MPLILSEADDDFPHKDYIDYINLAVAVYIAVDARIDADVRVAVVYIADFIFVILQCSESEQIIICIGFRA